MGIRDELLELATFTANRTLARFDGLDDDEFHWLPAPGAWTVRTLPVSGRVVVDHTYYPPGDPPLTTIGWRIAHLIDIYGSPRNAEWLRASPSSAPTGRLPWVIAMTAGESLALLRAAIEHFVDVIRSVDDEQWWEKLGPRAGEYADSSLAALALHQLDEAIHHAAEVGVLRDLYARRGATAAGSSPEPTVETLRERGDGVAAAADLGRWDLVEALVDAGCDVNAAIDGRTALHHAAAQGDLAMVRLLLDRGAGLDGHDAVFGATPLGWAEYFGRRDVAAHLREAGAA